METLRKLANRAVQMDMPVFVMRNNDEEEEKAAAEWYKVLGAIFGAEEKAEEIYKAKIAEIEKN